jgi:hypothetical protein
VFSWLETGNRIPHSLHCQNCYILCLYVYFTQSENFATLACSDTRKGRHSGLNLVSEYPPADSNLNLATLDTTPCRNSSLESECADNISNDGFGKRTTPRNPDSPEQTQSTTPFSWLDRLVFSVDADPFHADWPFWRQEGGPLATVEAQLPHPHSQIPIPPTPLSIPTDRNTAPPTPPSPSHA